MIAASFFPPIFPAVSASPKISFPFTVDIGVCLAVLKSAFLAMSPGVFCRNGSGTTFFAIGDSAPDVFGTTNRFQVPGVYAASNPAKVVQLQPFRYRSNKGFIRQPVGKFRHGMRASGDSHSKPSVTVSADFGHPKPATGVRLRNALGFNSFDNGLEHVTPLWLQCLGPRSACNTSRPVQTLTQALRIYAGNQ